MLECDQITCNRDWRELFSQLSFSLNEEESLLIQGSNGVGKTTLLQILAGYRKPNAGRVLYAGKDIYKASSAKAYEKNSWYISHKNGVVPHLTVAEQMALWCNLTGNQHLVEATISHFELYPYLDWPIHKLSQGWQKRISLTRLMLFPRKIWLLDEPFVNLDKRGIEALSYLIQSRIKQKGAVIIVQHGDVEMPNKKVLDMNQYAGASEVHHV